MSQNKDPFDLSLSPLMPKLDLLPIKPPEPTSPGINFDPTNFDLSLPDLDNYKELPDDTSQLNPITEPVVTGLTEMPPGIARKLIIEGKNLSEEEFTEKMSTTNAFSAHSALGPLTGKTLVRSSLSGTERFYNIFKAIKQPQNPLEVAGVTYSPVGLAWRFAKRIHDLTKQSYLQGRVDVPFYVLGGLGYDVLKAGLDVLSLPLKGILLAEQSQIKKAYPETKANPESIGAAKAAMAKEIINELGGILYPETSYALTGQRYGMGDWLWDTTGRLKSGVVKVLEKVMAPITKTKEELKAKVQAIQSYYGIDVTMIKAPLYAATATEKVLGAAKWIVDHATLKDAATVWTAVAEDPIMFLSFGSSRILNLARPVVDSLAMTNPTRTFLNGLARAAVKDPEGLKLLLTGGREAAEGREALTILQRVFKPKAEWKVAGEELSEVMKPRVIKEMGFMPIESSADWTALKTIEKVAKENPDAIDAYIKVIQKLGGKDPLYAPLKELGKARLYGLQIADQVVPFTDFLASKNKTLISLFYHSVGMATNDIVKILQESGIPKSDKEYYTKVQGLLTFLRKRMRNLAAHGMEDVNQMQDALTSVMKLIKSKGAEYGIKPEDINYIQSTVIQRFFGSNKISGEKVLDMYVKEGKIHPALQYSPLYRDMQVGYLKVSKPEPGVLDHATVGYRHGATELNKQMAERFYRVFSDEQTRKFLSDPDVQEGIRTVININEEILKRETDPTNVFIQALRGEINIAQMTSRVEDTSLRNISQFYDIFRNKGLQNPYLRYTYNHIWRIDKKRLGSLPIKIRRRVANFLTETLDTSWKHRKMVFPVDPFHKTLIDVLETNKVLDKASVEKLYRLSGIGGAGREKAEQEAFRIVKNAFHRWVDRDGIKAVKQIEELEHGGLAYFPALHEIDAAARSGYLVGRPIEGFIEVNPIVATQMRLQKAAKAFASEKVSYEVKTQLLKHGWAVPLTGKPAKVKGVIEKLSRETGMPWVRGIGPLRDVAIPLEIDTAIKKYINYFLAPNPDKSGLQAAFQRFTRWWKRMMTIYYPGFHSRNVITNMVLAEMNGIRLLTSKLGRQSLIEGAELVGKSRNVERDVLEGISKRGKAIALNPVTEVKSIPAKAEDVLKAFTGPQFTPTKEMVEDVLRISKEAALTDLRNVGDKYITTVSGVKIPYKTLINEIDKNNVLGGWVKEELTKGKVTTFTKIGGAAGEIAEGHARVSAYIYLRKLGYSPDTAGEWVARTFYNYNELPRAIKSVRESYVPFASWYYFTLLGPNNILRLLRRNPRWLIAPTRLRQYLEWKLKINPLALPDIYWESWGIPLGTELKYYNGDRHPVVNFAPLASYLPQFNINMYFHPVKTVLDMSHPMIKYAAEVITRRRIFSGKDIELFGTKKRKILGLPLGEFIEHLISTTMRAPRELQRAGRVLGIVGEEEGELATSSKFLNFIKLMLGLNTYGAMGARIVSQRAYRVEKNIKIMERQARKALEQGDTAEYNDLVRQIEQLRLIVNELKKIEGSL